MFNNGNGTLRACSGRLGPLSSLGKCTLLLITERIKTEVKIVLKPWDKEFKATDMSGTPLMPVPLPQQSLADPRSSGAYHSHQKSPKESSLPFLKEDQFTDTVIVVEGKKLYINRCILGYASPHFQRLLDNAQKSATAEKKTKTEIKISDKSYIDFVDLLTYLHPATSNDVTGT